MVTNIRKLRSNTKEILSSVARGNTVFISNRGKTCAKIVAVKDDKKPLMSLAGMWKGHKKTGSVRAFINKLRASRYVD